MESTKKIGTLTTESIDNSQEYLKNSWEYYKLKLFMHSAELTTSILKYSLLGFCVLMGLILSSIALAIFLGSVFENEALGYIAVGTIYFVLMFILFLMRKTIEKIVVLRLSKSILHDN